MTSTLPLTPAPIGTQAHLLTVTTDNDAIILGLYSTYDDAHTALLAYVTERMDEDDNDEDEAQAPRSAEAIIATFAGFDSFDIEPMVIGE